MIAMAVTDSARGSAAGTCPVGIRRKAAMPVKCTPRMTAARRNMVIALLRSVGLITAKCPARPPTERPIRIEAAIIWLFQIVIAGTRRAAMPV